MAEDALQEAMARAVRVWPLRGVPERPEAWIWTVARNALTDRLRRAARQIDLVDAETVARQGGAGHGGAAEPILEAPAMASPGPDLRAGLGDEDLAMLFLCAHPALATPTRVALTLKAVAGFGTEEIARAFLLSDATVAQRIVRAKRRVRAGELRLEMPPASALPGRRAAVLDVLYLVFAEGYARPGEPLGAELMEEAIRLAERLARHPAGASPELDALRALLWLQSSRQAARRDPQGRLLPLAEQDRTRWDRARIERGLRLLARAARGERISSYHLLAGIAACHAVAPRPEDTDWPRILRLYDDLVDASPDDQVLRLNRAVALAQVAGPKAALDELVEVEADPRGRRHPQLPALRAELLSELGRREEAARHFEEAARRAPGAAARAALEERAGRERGDSDAVP